ncbi:MAG: T9SS type A sorting domain-containing protein [Bacteroidota bacterium]
MRTVLFLLGLFALSTLSFSQSIVNPFDSNRNEFNQKDFISVVHGLNGDMQQQIFAYDWITALDVNADDTVVPLSEADDLGDNASGYVVLETGNFNGDGKDDIFYLVEKNGRWTYGVTEQDPELDLSDSLYHFSAPAAPVMTNGASLASDHSYPCLAIGDFDGDGTDEAAVAWAQNEEVRVQIIEIRTSDGTLTVSPSSVYSDVEFAEEISGRYAIALSAGDMNGDGTDELILTSAEPNTTVPEVRWNAFLRIFDLSTDGDLNLLPKGRVVYDDTNLRSLDDSEGGSINYTRTTVQAVRSEVSLKDEGPETIFAASVINRSSEFTNYDYIFPFHIIPSLDLETLNVIAGPTTDNGNNYKYDSPCESKRGDVNGDAIDDVVILAGANYRIYTFAEGNLELAYDGGISAGIDIDNTNPLNESNDRLAVGDVNRDGLDDIITQSLFVDQDEQEFKYTIQVLRSDADFNLMDGGHYDLYIESTNPPKYHGFAIGNLDGNDICLGEPTIQSCSFFKPVMILEAIPSHFDIIDDEQYDPMGCYEFDNPNACGNAVVFRSSASTQETSEVTVSSDWNVSAEITAGFEIEGFGMNSSLGMKYGEQFSQTTDASDTYTVEIEVTANGDDFLQVVEFPFQMNEYPVLNSAGNTITWIVAAFPTLDGPSEHYRLSKALYNYLPNHEIGNILSYPKPTDEDQFYDRSADNDWFIAPFGNMPIQQSGNLNFTLTTEASSGLSTSSTTSQTLNASVGVSGFGLGATVKGEYTESETKVFGQTLTAAETFSISGANVIGGTNTWEYAIEANLYWTLDQAPKIGMAVDFSEAGSRWQELYGQQVDPALNLPYRYENVLNSDYLEENLDRTKSIRFNKINPNPGDTVTAFVKVFNYSLRAMTGALPFSLYHGHPNEGGTQIADLEGNTLFSSEDLLTDQGRATVEVSFVVTAEMIADTDTRIYVELDPFDEITEIHEDNNIGWTNLGYVCNTPEGVITADEVVLEEDAIRLRVFPNPAQRQINIDFQNSLRYLDENLSIRIYDVSGRLVQEEGFDSDQLGTYTFDINQLSAGVYIYQIATAREQIHSGKLVVGR